MPDLSDDLGDVASRTVSRILARALRVGVEEISRALGRGDAYQRKVAEELDSLNLSNRDDPYVPVLIDPQASGPTDPRLEDALLAGERTVGLGLKARLENAGVTGIEYRNIRGRDTLFIHRSQINAAMDQARSWGYAPVIRDAAEREVYSLRAQSPKAALELANELDVRGFAYQEQVNVDPRNPSSLIVVCTPAQFEREIAPVLEARGVSRDDVSSSAASPANLEAPETVAINGRESRAPEPRAAASQEVPETGTKEVAADGDYHEVTTPNRASQQEGPEKALIDEPGDKVGKLLENELDPDVPDGYFPDREHVELKEQRAQVEAALESERRHAAPARERGETQRSEEQR